MEYPSPIIYPSDMPKKHREFVADEVRSAYLMGQHSAECQSKPTDPLAGYSNLTAAISAGEPIDWEKLDGKKVMCAKSDVHTLEGELKRFSHYYPFTSNAWWDDDADPIYVSALERAWKGKDGWTLWVEGDIPMRRKTADQLEVGRFFTGKLSCTVRENLMCVADEYGRGKHVRFAADFSPSRYPATEWVVLEEYGPFQKPEGK